MKNLADAIEKSGVKMTFGLQPHHIKVIEERIAYWNKPFKFNGEMVSNKMQYDKALWEDCGKRLSWEPFTLALYYFEYLDSKKVGNAPENQDGTDLTL